MQVSAFEVAVFVQINSSLGAVARVFELVSLVTARAAALIVTVGELATLRPHADMFKACEVPALKICRPVIV